MAFWLNVHYIVVLAWAIYYLYNSISYDVPWRGCSNAWNSPKCASEYDLARTERECYERMGPNNQVCKVNSTLFTSPVKEYWEWVIPQWDCMLLYWYFFSRKNVLQVTSGMGELGSVRWPLAFTLFLAWIACYFAIWKGVKWTGKVCHSNLFATTVAKIEFNQYLKCTKNGIICWIKSILDYNF